MKKKDSRDFFFTQISMRQRHQAMGGTSGRIRQKHESAA